MLVDALREFLPSFGPSPRPVSMSDEPDALTLTISVGPTPGAGGPEIAGFVIPRKA